jgi:hypothetical protein
VVDTDDQFWSSDVTATFTASPNFTAALYALPGNVTSLTGLGVDPYGYLNYMSFLSDGFALVAGSTTLGGSANGVVFDGGDGYFFGQNVTITGTTGGYNPGTGSYTAYDVLAVAAWTGGYSSLAAAEASGSSRYGIIAFVNPIGPGGANPEIPGLVGWPTTPLPAEVANDSGIPDLVMSPIPEPTTMALGALGGLSLLLFRRKQS